MHRILSSGFLAVVLLATSSRAAAHVEGTGNGSASIVRDDYGVPHVFGSTLRAVFYGLGYAQGHDRLWQAEIHRRIATGTLAEFMGPSSIAGDVQSRTIFGPPERRAALLAAASEDLREMLQAYADGMNVWIQEATASGQLPVEYAAFGVSPRPWVVDDSLAAFMLFSSQFGWFGNEELTSAQMLTQLMAMHGPAEGQKVFADTHWLDDPETPTTVPATGAFGPRPHGFGGAFEMPSGLNECTSKYNQGRKAFLENLDYAGIRPGPASNAVVLAPKLTKDGRALLLGGPQMGFGAPQINHEVGVHGARFDVTGTQIAGLPGVLIGVGHDYAWTITSGLTDNTDIYAEVLNATGQYLFNGEWLNLACRVETIHARSAPSQNVSVCETVHGPIIAMASGVAFAMKAATRGEELTSLEAWINLGRSPSVSAFDRELSKIAYNFNIFRADTHGDIRYWHIGRIPVRAAGDNPWLPHNGVGSAEWQGFIPWADMPRAANPRQGWLTSWNNKPQEGWLNSAAGYGTFGPVHRVNTLIKLLEKVEPHSADMASLKEINRKAGMTTDTPSGSAYTVFAPTLLNSLVAHLDLSADPRLPEIAAILTQWDWLQLDADSDGHYDSPAVAIFNTWWSALVARVFADDLGANANANVVSNLVARLLDDSPAVPVLHDYLDGESIEQAVTASLVAALGTLTTTYASNDATDWRQPVATIFWKPSGAGAVPNTLWMNRGTYNQVVHLGVGAHFYAENVVAPGQSGDPLSPHFSDQLPLYTGWHYKPMILDRRDLHGHTESEIRLDVP